MISFLFSDYSPYYLSGASLLLPSDGICTHNRNGMCNGAVDVTVSVFVSGDGTNAIIGARAGACYCAGTGVDYVDGDDLVFFS